MSDDYNISYSYQTGAAAPQPAPPQDEELIAFTHYDRVDLGNTATLLLNRSNGQQLTVAPEVATALTYCTTFKPLAAHADTLVNTIPQLKGQLEDVTKVLTLVKDNGLMLRATEVCDRLANSQSTDAELAPTRVCIITCDRPQAVERLLDSMLRAGNLSRHDQLFLVDDSRSPENTDQNRELVAKFNLTSSKNMGYLGPGEQRNFLDALIAARPDQEQSIRHLIDRANWSGQQTYGLSRTLCLLLTVGYRCIILDDDILCSRVKPPFHQDGVSFGGGSNRELACFSTEQELIQQAVLDDEDPLSGHAAHLGKTLGQALPALNGHSLAPESLRDANAALLNSLSSNSPILVTQCGSWGDPGTPDTSWLYQLGTESVRRVLTTVGLEQAMTNRHYWLGRPRPNIAKMAVMSQATGIDNSRLMPPYFPAFRGEDYLFASMVLCMHPDSAVLDYDWCVPHLPVEQRGAGSVHPGAAQVGLPLLARYLADRVAFTGGLSVELRLEKLVASLRELAEQSHEDLLATLRAELCRQRAGQLKDLTRQQQQSEQFNSPEWDEFLQKGVEAISNSLQTPASPADIPGVPDGVSEHELINRGKATLQDFSNAVAAWPAIRENAATVSARMLADGDLSP